jgi:hypothetical protein
MGAPQWAREYRGVTSGSTTTIYIKQYTISKVHKISSNSINKNTKNFRQSTD